MVSDRQASVHQSLQRRRCDVGCRCASRSSSCRAYSPRLKSAAPKCCDSPSRVSTPRPSFPLLFAQSNFSVSCELPLGQERAVADCVLVDPVLLHLVPNRHLQQPSGGRRSSVSRGGRPTALGAAQTGSCNSSSCNSSRTAHWGGGLLPIARASRAAYYLVGEHPPPCAHRMPWHNGSMTSVPFMYFLGSFSSLTGSLPPTL